MSSTQTATDRSGARTRGREVERLLAVARAYGDESGEIPDRVELHACPDRRGFGHGAVIGSSGREVARIAVPDDRGYPHACAAWEALQPSPGIRVAIRSVSIDMNGGIQFA